LGFTHQYIHAAIELVAYNQKEESYDSNYPFF
jgi:hypothetical protein